MEKQQAVTAGILDANVMIDYGSTDPSVLRLVTRHICRLAVIDFVLAEVDQFSTDDCHRLGIQIINADIGDLISAGNPCKGLSFQDQLCLSVSRRLHLTCITNDGKLRRECSKERIEVMWGLNLMLDLVRKGKLNSHRAHQIVRDMQEINPCITKSVVADFIDKVGYTEQESS